MKRTYKFYCIYFYFLSFSHSLTYKFYCIYFYFLSFSHSLTHTQTHTHTHAYKRSLGRMPSNYRLIFTSDKKAIAGHTRTYNLPETGVHDFAHAHK